MYRGLGCGDCWDLGFDRGLEFGSSSSLRH